MDEVKLKRIYGRLKGIKEVISIQEYVRAEIARDYDKLVHQATTALGEDLNDFLLPADACYNSAGGDRLCKSSTLRGKLLQLLSFFEYGMHLSDQMLEVGSIYNSISDPELKARCSDILSAPGNFDRVINQATLVLEERIRAKSKLTEEIGVQLVNKAINSDISKSVLKLSDDPDEHEGFGHICRGIVLSFRNPTHHRIVQSYTREDALKFCAFVDSLLRVIDVAK